jgi:hypothetical protein
MLETLITLSAMILLFVLVAILVLALYSALFHLRHAVAFVPTPRVISDTMINLAALKSGDVLMDLGAGDGRILDRALERIPEIRAIGYEGSFGVWVLAKVRHLFVRQKPVMLYKNFLIENVSDASVVFLYLSVDMMKRLKPKLEAELRPGSRVVSHAFLMHGWEPVKTESITMPFFGKTNVYLYQR